ncbi:MAG: hypothetical protein OXI92_06640, partial [Acidobacteriota bacterium]|nr:hypothetical protein [Acidobacteriota bacterium]
MPLFHSRMIRPAGRGRCLIETKEKELSTKAHKGRRRATKRDGPASAARTATHWMINIDGQDKQDIQDMVFRFWCPEIGESVKPDRIIA